MGLFAAGSGGGVCFCALPFTLFSREWPQSDGCNEASLAKPRRTERLLCGGAPESHRRRTAKGHDLRLCPWDRLPRLFIWPCLHGIQDGK